jgi:hypothetical protein
MFNANELKEGASQLVDLDVGVQDVLVTMHATPSLFKTLTNFILGEFEELAIVMISNIVNQS